MELPNQQRLHLLCNHFKSKSGGEAGSDPRRQRQAERVAEILQDYDLDQDLVIVAGDLNDTPDAASPLRPLLDVAGLHDVLELQFPTEANPKRQQGMVGIYSLTVASIEIGRGAIGRTRRQPSVRRTSNVPK